MAKGNGSNGLRGKQAQAAHPDTRSGKLPGRTASIQDLWDRIDSLYDDTVHRNFTVNEASALSRIVGRQISLLSIASVLERRQQSRSTLLLLSKK